MQDKNIGYPAKIFMKKIISIILILATLLCCLSGCMSENPFQTNETDENGEIIGEETTQGEYSPINHIMISLISYEINDFQKMHFADYKQSLTEPSEKGTAITLVIESASEEMPVSNIEKVVIKNVNGTAMNMSTKTFITNSEDCCVVFTKTEGIHELTKFVIEIKTYDGKELLMPMPTDLAPINAQKFATASGTASNGDLVIIKDQVYFIIQDGVLGFTAANSSGKTIVETITGVILVPLANTFAPHLAENDFATQFFDNDNVSDYGVNTSLTVNSKEMFEAYGDSAKGLYAEMITCTFTLTGEDNLNAEEVIRREDYVVQNTWIKGKFAENFLLNIY